MADRGSPTIRRRLLGMKLRELRISAGLHLDQVAKMLECSESKVSRIETGDVRVTPRDVGDLLEFYGVTEAQQEELMQAARKARETGWWQAYNDVLPSSASAYIGLEAAADEIRTYEALLVPGLLQTTAYAEAVIRVLHPNLLPHEVNRLVELREGRQAMLRQDDPPAIWAILDEAVVRRPVGGPKVMRQQLQRLVDDSALETLTIQVLPFQAGEHAGMYGSFTILGFRDSTQLDAVYLENPAKELAMEKDEDLLPFTRAFEHLRASAIDPETSAALLVELGDQQ